MNIKSCIFVVLTFTFIVNAAPGEKGSQCKVAGIGAIGTHCTEKACGFFLSVPFSRGTCDGGLNCCWGQPPSTPTPSSQATPNQTPQKEPPPNQPPPNQPPPNQPPPNQPQPS